MPEPAPSIRMSEFTPEVQSLRNIEYLLLVLRETLLAVNGNKPSKVEPPVVPDTAFARIRAERARRDREWLTNIWGPSPPIPMSN